MVTLMRRRELQAGRLREDHGPAGGHPAPIPCSRVDADARATPPPPLRYTPVSAAAIAAGAHPSSRLPGDTIMRLPSFCRTRTHGRDRPRRRRDLWRNSSSRRRLCPPRRVMPAAAVAQPPVLDRELFFGNPEITGAQILARRPVHRVHQAVQGHAQRLGEEDGRAVQRRAPDHRRHEAADPRLLLEPRQQVHPLSSRTTPATRTTTSTP